MFGFETPAMAPLACKNAVIWLAMRDPIERIISRLYKPKKGSKSSETFLDSIGGEAAVLRALDKTTWFHSTAHTVGTRSTGAKPLAGKPTWSPDGTLRYGRHRREIRKLASLRKNINLPESFWRDLLGPCGAWLVRLRRQWTLAQVCDSHALLVVEHRTHPVYPFDPFIYFLF